jgi:hypothetical protein
MAEDISNDLFSIVFRVKGGIFCPFRSGNNVSGEIGASDSCGAAAEPITIEQLISRQNESANKNRSNRKFLTFIQTSSFPGEIFFFYYTREAGLRTAEDEEPVPDTNRSYTACRSFSSDDHCCLAACSGHDTV